MNWVNINWTATSEFGTYRLCEQRRFRRACASVQSRQNLRCSLIQAVSQEEPSDRKPDPWSLWMAGHAQLKFVMTECSKTQIRLMRPNFTLDSKFIACYKDKSAVGQAYRSGLCMLNKFISELKMDLEYGIIRFCYNMYSVYTKSLFLRYCRCMNCFLSIIFLLLFTTEFVLKCTAKTSKFYVKKYYWIRHLQMKKGREVTIFLEKFKNTNVSLKVHELSEKYWWNDLIKSTTLLKFQRKNEIGLFPLPMQKIICRLSDQFFFGHILGQI